MTGFLFTTVVVVTVALIAFRVGPSYIEYFTVQKALGDALAAVARVEGTSLVVLGDGPERVALEQRTAALGLTDRVRFLGAGTRDDVVLLFRAVDAALLTSAWENLPHTVGAFEATSQHLVGVFGDVAERLVRRECNGQK